MLFFQVNFPVSGTNESLSLSIVCKLLYWSVTNDLVVICVLQAAWLLAWGLAGLARMRWLYVMVGWFFLLIHFFVLLLNAVDIFYVHFQRQRANADLLYVTRHPFHKTVVHHPWWTLTCLASAALFLYLLYYFWRPIRQRYEDGWRPWLSGLLLTTLLAVLFLVSPGRQMPTYPLVSLSSNQLMYVQNSFHSFLYSLYRNNDGMVEQFAYIPSREAAGLVPVWKKNETVLPGKRNVVLFIMESIPEDFFDENGPYKVAMPFLDSLRNHSLYFDRAYSYSHNSNKGIVAILGGMPTLTEIPLYHSSYTGLPMTHIGSRLADSGYRSLFFIGDDYDDFGFAKCVNWMGFTRYYSKTDLPGYRNMETHTMGLHDRYVLGFMGEELDREKQPFFAVHYNTSTHYPNDLPKAYREAYPKMNRSAQMKSMSYYNRCLQDFFTKASTTSWFRNTVFVFCSDHWMFPDTRSPVSDVVQSFRIPVMIYDPQNPSGVTVQSPVSQLDIMNTVLAITGDSAPFLSYGENLLDTAKLRGRVIFSRENANLYQVFDENYVLGFSPVSGKVEFCYDISMDKERKNNLVSRKIPAVQKLETRIRAFLQRSSSQYTDPGFRP